MVSVIMLASTDPGFTDNWLRMSGSLVDEKGINSAVLRCRKVALVEFLAKLYFMVVPGRTSFSKKKTTWVGSLRS